MEQPPTQQEMVVESLSNHLQTLQVQTPTQSHSSIPTQSTTVQTFSVPVLQTPGPQSTPTTQVPQPQTFFHQFQFQQPQFQQFGQAPIVAFQQANPGSQMHPSSPHHAFPQSLYPAHPTPTSPLPQSPTPVSSPPNFITSSTPSNPAPPSTSSNVISLSHQPGQKSSTSAPPSPASPSSVIQTCVDANAISAERIQQLITQQHAFLLNPAGAGEEKWRELQLVIQQVSKDLTNQLKVLQYINKQVILEPYPLHQSYYLESTIETEMKQVELLYNQLCTVISPCCLPSTSTVALMVTRQPFPDVLMKDKQLSDDVLHVQLLTAAGIQVEALSQVRAESDFAGKDAMSSVSFTEQALDPSTKIAKFPIKVNVGSRKSLVHLKFSVDLRIGGENLRLQSTPTRPFIVITNDSQWEDSMEMIVSNDTYQGRKEVEWNAFCNSIQRHFLRATYQDPSSPARYLSTLDFLYFNDKFFNKSRVYHYHYMLELVQYEKFLEFWKYFGKALHVLRFNRVVMKLWQIGLVYGFMSRTDINNALLAHEPGTFIIRFSESYPGQFVIGYVGEGDTIKHYLVERADLEKKTVPEFLLECKEFTNILQCIGFTSDAKRPVFRAIHKANALSYFTQTLTTTPVAAKPGYDPLETHWTRVAAGNNRKEQNSLPVTFSGPTQKRRKRGPDGEPQ